MRLSILAIAASVALVSAEAHHGHEAFHLRQRGAMGTGSPALTTSTIYTTTQYTITSCAPTVISCPASSTVVVTSTIPAYTTVCPVTAVPSTSSYSTQSYVYSNTTTTSTATSYTTTCFASTYTSSGTTYTTTVTSTLPISSTTVTVKSATSTSTSTSLVCPTCPAATVVTYTAYVTASPSWAYSYTTKNASTTYTTSTVNSTCTACLKSPTPTPPKAMIKRAAPTPSAGASGLWAMTYSPYQNSGGCKGASEVDADIAKIAGLGFTAVRIYSTDCSGLQNVGDAAKAHGIKLILGIYIDATGIEASKGQVQAIQAWAQWDLVEMIVVGNEAVFNGFCSAGDLASYISYCKSAFSGYSGPITTSEPLNILQENTSTICAVVDVVGCNVHPYFNSATTADQAGSFASSELDLLKGLCPGKTAYILETGWPNAGSANGAAVPGIAEQQTAITGIKGTVGTVATFFSFVDDGWKQPGPLGVENHWGCSSVFGG